MARYIEHVRGDLVDYLRPFPYKFADGRTFTGYGDWLSIVFDMKHNEVLNNLFNGRTVKMMAEMAEAVGKTRDAAAYRALFANMKAAFDAAYVSADEELKDKTQAEYAMALDYGFLPEARTSLAVNHLAKDILENSHQQTFADALGKNPIIPPGHLTTGFHGSRALLPALSQYGRNDVAYALLLQDTYPSWLYLVKIGATTIWERWDSWMPEKGFQDPRMNSFNMPNLGASIGEWLFSCVGGIDTDGAGFRKILIKPYIGDGLTWARTSYNSIRGTITVRWEKGRGSLVVDVTIPANASATVSLPRGGTGPGTIREGGKTIWSKGHYRDGVPGIFGARRTADRVDVDVGSGNYSFGVTWSRL
jgi:alpha-L-rhamnosidase